jgi:hypothetical protein
MRVLFLLFVLANVAFFAYTRFAGAPGTRDPGAQARQIEADKIRVLTSAQGAARARVPERPDRACFEWGPFPVAELTVVRNAIENLARDVEITERRVASATGWWVFIPPLPNRLAANQRIAELRSQGEDVSLVVEDPKLVNAVSLGVYPSEEAAGKRFAEVRKRGVAGAVMGPREAGQRAFLRFADAPKELRGRIAEQRSAFPNAEVGECAR